MLVVSDSSPINVLIRMNREGVLATLFHRVLIPPAVEAELTRDTSPPEVRAFVRQPHTSTMHRGRGLTQSVDAIGSKRLFWN